jgi:hypothetical protein
MKTLGIIQHVFGLTIIVLAVMAPAFSTPNYSKLTAFLLCGVGFLLSGILTMMYRS